MALTPDILDREIAERRDVVARALAAIYTDRPERVSLGVVERSAAALPADLGVASVGAVLLMTLQRHGTAARFVAFLRAQGHDPLAEQGSSPDIARYDADYGTVAIGRPARDDLSQNVAAFAARAQAFRCLIRVNGEVKGSGAFVSPRLVLTAAHVLADAPSMDGRLQVAAPVEVEAADDERHPARLAWGSSWHESEALGQLPPAASAATHCDAALLRIDRPLGRMLGRIALPPAPPDWTGPGVFVLIHAPGGAARGLAVGRILREGPGDLRQFHTVDTGGGSSGGPGFDREFVFLGLHQGVWQSFRRIVPYARLLDDPGFRAALDSDRPPRTLWSLDGTLGGHLVIGQQRFVEAVNAVVEGDAPQLRGLWIKRADTGRDEGLSFAYAMLCATLAAHEAADRTIRIPTGLEVSDLLADVHRLAFGTAGGSSRGGVRRDETTAVAHDDDRARALADAMQAKAAEEGRRWWLHFDNPPSGLREETQIQLEHLVEEALVRPDLRLVLSGFETYDLGPRLFASAAEARAANQPGLVGQYLQPFRRSEVAATVQAMDDALGLGWTGAARDLIVARALAGVPELAHHIYDRSHLPTVAERLREEAATDARNVA